MQFWLERQWCRIGLWHLLLWPVSWVFRIIVTLRKLAYRLHWLSSAALPVLVIVVGNISVGGTGKTPLVIWLVDFLRQHGYRPGVISRGYGGRCRDLVAITKPSDPFAVGDEPVLIARRAGCPVWVGRNRAKVGAELLRAHPECNILISDDGLQHYALSRDLEIAVVDGARGFGNGLLLPAGPLREPAARLQSVDAIVVQGDAPYPAFRMALNGSCFRNVANPLRTCLAEAFASQPAHAIAGIGNPARFFQQLNAMGLVIEPRAFPDHHPYCSQDLEFSGDSPLLMTEKDAVKCAAFAKPNWWYLEVTAGIDGAFGEMILDKLKR